MKIVFGIILLFHSLIHLLGFLKAFGIVEIRQLQLGISRPLGFLWLLCVFLFLYVLFLFLLNRPWWPFFALAAVIISQSLIILAWQDAKFGSIINLIILLVSIPALGSFYFQKKTEKEVKELVQPNEETGGIITKEDIKALPDMVQKWMKNSGVIGKPRVHVLRLKQEGRMKTKPEGNWMPFMAQQYFNVKDPGFIWTTRVESGFPIYLDGRDKLLYGKGEMLIKLLSLFPVVNERDNSKIDSGTAQRFLAEISWFPSAALNENITWEELKDNLVRANLDLYGNKVSGVFKFSEHGEPISFETQRFYGGKVNSKKETWIIEMLSFKEFSGYKIPNKCKLTWKLPDGDFTWLELEVTEIDYNIAETFR